MYGNIQRQLALPAHPVLDWAVMSEPTHEAWRSKVQFVFPNCTQEVNQLYPKDTVSAVTCALNTQPNNM